MKEQIKIRKSWLLDPSTKIEPSNKIKQKFKEEKKQNWNKLTGYIKDEDLEYFEDKEDDKE
jgi:hypothetical protein